MSARSSTLTQRVRRLFHVLEPEPRAPDTVSDPPLGAADNVSSTEHAQILAAVTALEKQIGRAGREQLKANTLAEAHLERLTAALEALRAADARRDAEVATLQDQSRAAQVAARRAVALSLLPVLDGLDAALQAGQHVLEQSPVAAPPPDSVSDAPPTLLQRVFGRQAAATPAIQPNNEGMGLRDDLRAWLVGLTFVRQRLLDVLAAEGITPIAALGLPFDPYVHSALHVVPAREGLPSGTVAAELRRGYRIDDRVLRPAEVAVARNDEG